MCAWKKGRALPSELLSTPVWQPEPDYDTQSLSAGQQIVFPAEISPLDFPAIVKRWSCYHKVIKIPINCLWANFLPQCPQMTSYSVTLDQSFVHVESAPKQPAAIENSKTLLTSTYFSTFINNAFIKWIVFWNYETATKTSMTQLVFTSFSSSLIL